MSKIDELIQQHESTSLALEPESQGYILRDCDAARAELAALRERIGKLEAALVKADELERAAFSAEAYMAQYEPSTHPARHSVEVAVDAYRAAREAAK